MKTPIPQERRLGDTTITHEDRRPTRQKEKNALYLALGEKSVDDRRAGRYERRLEHVRQQAQDGVEAFPLASLLLDLKKNKKSTKRERKAGKTRLG